MNLGDEITVGHLGGWLPQCITNKKNPDNSTMAMFFITCNYYFVQYEPCLLFSDVSTSWGLADPVGNAPPRVS